VITAFALGIDPAAQGDYELLSGRDATAPDAMVADDDFLRAIKFYVKGVEGKVPGGK
jgi:hypothetical protein